MLTPCIFSTRCDDGYGYAAMYDNGRVRREHRVLYERKFGPLETSQILHHKCENKRCINLDHLQVVSRGEHLLLHDAGKISGERRRARTHCANGHEYTAENTHVDAKGSRNCRACWRERWYRRRAKVAA